MQAHEWKNVPAPRVTMVSFGQPRVGNLPFAEDYGALHAGLCVQICILELVLRCPMQHAALAPDSSYPCTVCSQLLDPHAWMLMDADKVVPDSWRVKNSNDFVTRIPSLLGYQHIGTEVYTLLSRKTVNSLCMTMPVSYYGTMWRPPTHLNHGSIVGHSHNTTPFQKARN